METTKKTNKESEHSEELQEKAKNTSDGELTDDDAQAVAGGNYPIFPGLVPEKDSVRKPL